MKRLTEGRLVSIGLIALVASAAGSAVALGAAARRMPLLVALPTLALLAVDWRRSRSRTTATAPAVHDEVRLLAWLAGLVAATWGLGVLIGPPAFLAAYLRWQSRERWRMVALLASGLWLVVFVVLNLVLRLPVGGALEAWWLP